MTAIPVFTLSRLHERVGDELVKAVKDVVVRGQLVLGPETEAFEHELGDWYGVHAVSVASGTDALVATLLACGVHPGSEVIVPGMTMAATAIAVREVGAHPVVVDVRPDDLLLDIAAALRAVTERTSAIIPVHLYGQVQDLASLVESCRERRIAVIEDACQSFGGKGIGRTVQGDAAATSFYPTKNLGGWGAGGAVLTARDDVVSYVRAWRHYGERVRYLSEFPGRNSRLDEIQCAILRRKLRVVEGLMTERRALVARYMGAIPETVRIVGAPRGDPADALHLLAVRMPRRREVMERLGSMGIGTGIHYPVPVHQQPAVGGSCPFGAPEAESASAELLTLPLFPGMRDDEVDTVGEGLGARA